MGPARLSRQNSECARFHRSCSRLVTLAEVVPLDEHVARVDRLREVEDGVVVLVVIVSSVSRQLRPPHGPQSLDLAPEFGDAVQLDLGGKVGWSR